jgi:hypothetical protein
VTHNNVIDVPLILLLCLVFPIFQQSSNSNGNGTIEYPSDEDTTECALVVTNTQHKQQSLGRNTTDSDTMVAFERSFDETPSVGALVAMNTPHTPHNQYMGLIDSKTNETRVIEWSGGLSGDEVTDGLALTLGGDRAKANVLTTTQSRRVLTAVNTNTR